MYLKVSDLRESIKNELSKIRNKVSKEDLEIFIKSLSNICCISEETIKKGLQDYDNLQS